MAILTTPSSSEATSLTRLLLRPPTSPRLTPRSHRLLRLSQATQRSPTTWPLTCHCTWIPSVAQPADTSSYLRLGQTYAATAPTVAGYNMITPSSPHTVTLTNANNTVNFVYSNTSSPAANDSSNDTNIPRASATDGDLASTGASIWLGVFAALGAIIGGAFLARRLMHR